MQCALREMRDEDLDVLFEQWADPAAAHMAAFTAPDHMDNDAFEHRWSRIRADNGASRRVLEKCGFRVVATERGFAEARSREIEEFVLRLG